MSNTIQTIERSMAIASAIAAIVSATIMCQQALTQLATSSTSRVAGASTTEFEPCRQD